MKKDNFEKIIVLFVWILGVIFLYWAIQKLTGHSPTTEQILLTAMGVFLGLIGHQQYKLGRIDEYMERNKEEIKELKNDFKEIKNRINEDLSFIKTKLTTDNSF